LPTGPENSTNPILTATTITWPKLNAYTTIHNYKLLIKNSKSTFSMICFFTNFTATVTKLCHHFSGALNGHGDVSKKERLSVI
jgi:hypothetical protein